MVELFLFNTAQLIESADVIRRQLFIYTLVQTIHDGLGVLDMVQAESVTDLMGKNTKQLCLITELIDIDLLCGDGADVFTFLKLSSR